VYYRHQHDQNDHRFRFFCIIVGLLSLAQGVVHLKAFFLGTYELRPAVKKAYQLRFKVSAACVSVAFRVGNRVVEEMYQFRPKGSAACTETRPNLLKRPGSEPARDTTHTHTHTHTYTHTHTQRSKDSTQRLSFRYFRRPRSLKCITLRNLFHMLWK